MEFKEGDLVLLNWKGVHPKDQGGVDWTAEDETPPEFWSKPQKVKGTNQAHGFQEVDVNGYHHPADKFLKVEIEEVDNEWV